MEHKRSVKKKSEILVGGIIEHLNLTGHTMDYDNIKILDQEDYVMTRIFP